MTARHRPPPDARLGHELAVATLRGATAEAQAIARKLLEREAEAAKRREEERRGRGAIDAFRRG